MALANYMLSYTDMDEIWMVISPHNPLKNKSSLLNQNHRLALVNLAIDDFQGIKSSTIEFNLPQPSYTINTLAHLNEKYPLHKFSLIMGQDNLMNFGKWKNHEAILKSYKIFVYPRQNSVSSEFDNHPNVHFTKAPIIEISSTLIRNAIKERKDVRFFLPSKVWNEIEAAGYYQH